LATKDLLHRSEEVPIHVLGGTGDVIFYKGQYHLFACIFPENRQLITHYISKDGSLNQWEYVEEDTFGPDGEIYDFSDWRDPRIIYREELDEFWMLLAARKKDIHSQTGCVGLCVSKDLKHWEVREPIYYPRRFNGALECPDCFRMGDWVYLVFSSYTTLFGTYYLKRRVGETEWMIPRNHRLDGRAFYAAKTAGTGDERFLFGWNPEKEQDLFGFWPSRVEAKDYRTWDWGGNMVIHQLEQKADGDLGLAMPQVFRNAFYQQVPNIYTEITDGWNVEEKNFNATGVSTQKMMLMQNMEESCYIKTVIHPKNATQVGVVLHVNQEMKEGYYLYLEPDRGRLVFRSWLRMSEEGGKTFPYDVELESPVRPAADGTYTFEILTEGTVGVAYVNRETALSFRMYDYTGRALGLFVLGAATFSEMATYRRKEGE
jgi:beta-fructofuranosidase